MTKEHQSDRRTFMGAGLGAAALLTMLDSTRAEAIHHDQENEFAEAEAANEKIVNDFCASFKTLDIEKITSYLADDCTFRMIETTPRMEGKEAIVTGMKSFLATAKSAEFEMIRSAAMGSIVINERIDHFDMGERQNAFHIVGIFFVRDGKIQEWQDYTMPKV